MSSLSRCDQPPACQLIRGITAIVPAYNEAGSIADTIVSLKRQTHPIAEIIVVDDCSTDDTGAIAGALAEMLAGRVALLCSEPFALRHGASWAPLADTSLHRGYDPGTTRRQPNVARMPDWLVTLLASAIGATPTAAPVPAASRAADHDAPSRLAARG